MNMSISVLFFYRQCNNNHNNESILFFFVFQVRVENTNCMVAESLAIIGIMIARVTYKVLFFFLFASKASL